jgi:hypothetical protein
VNAVAALMFVLQAISLGFTGSAMAGAAIGPLGAVCVTLDSGDGHSDSSPIERRHVCPCCVVHCNSAIEIDGGDTPTVVILRREAPAARVPSVFRIDATGTAPELRLLSPRAPPVFA